jgi:hypothetical protein
LIIKLTLHVAGAAASVRRKTAFHFAIGSLSRLRRLLHLPSTALAKRWRSDGAVTAGKLAFLQRLLEQNLRLTCHPGQTAPGCLVLPAIQFSKNLCLYPVGA